MLHVDKKEKPMFSKRGYFQYPEMLSGYTMEKKYTHFENMGLIWLQNNPGIESP